MTQKYLTTLTFAHQSGIPEQSVQWSIVTEAFDNVAITPATVGRITIPFGQFVNLVRGTLAIRSYLSAALSRGVDKMHFKTYDITAQLGGGVHGSPVAEDFDTLGAAQSIASLPSEVASVLTLRSRTPAGNLYPVEVPDDADAGPEVNRPRQRHAGRMFIGPLIDSALERDINNETFVRGQFMADCIASAEQLDDELQANNMRWCIWSRKDAAVYQVNSVEMDNAFDTQRRRGVDATARQSLIF